MRPGAPTDSQFLKYYEDTLQYRQELDAAIAAEELEREPSSPPLEPEPFYYASTVVNQGHAIELPAGSYRMTLRDSDGKTIRGSEKKLEVFEIIRARRFVLRNST